MQTTTAEPNSSSPRLDIPMMHSHPINLLPVEVLSEIMCYLPFFRGHNAPSIHPLDRDLDPSGHFTTNNPIRTPHWVAVSHVCYRWREIALKCKALWTCIPLVSVRWAQRAIELSDPYPITLHIDSKEASLDRGYMSVDALCHALLHLHRIRKIHMHSPWGTKYGDRIMAVVYGALCQGAPALEELDLSSQIALRVKPGPNNTIMSVFAELRTLRLDLCFVPADCFLFLPSLTHVQLSVTRSMWPTLESMLSTLALIPKVQVLGLCGALPTESYATSPPPAIDLPLLDELHLSGTGQGISAVLQALIFRDNVQVYVRVVSISLTPYQRGSAIT
ncbi:hypothetical protein BGW80DRAFT_1458961 [Lactifluus volemus]|nr:hypothetical protein BGW80DRAFT_1458961 [Lactifluus volemus]